MSDADSASGPTTPAASDWAPGWTVTLLERYPGPAMLVVAAEDGWSAGGDVRTANQRARALLGCGEASWLADIQAWLAAAGQAALEALAQTPVTADPAGTCVTRVPDCGPGGGDAFIEWRPVPVDAGCLALLGRDITMERRLRSSLQDSRQRFKDLVEIAADFAWETGPDGLFGFVTPGGALGYSVAELIGTDPRDLLPPELAGETAPAPFTTSEPVDEAEIWLQGADGAQACLLVSARPIFDGQGVWGGARGVCRDISEQRRRDAEMSRLRNRDRVLMYIVRAARDAVDPEQVVTGAAEHIGRALASHGCVIYGLDDDDHGDAGFREVARYGPAPPAAATRLVGELSLDQPVRNTDPGERAVGDDAGPGDIVLGAVTRHRGQVNGAVLVWRPGDEAAWTAEDQELLSQVADQLGIAQAQRRYQRHLRRLSETDELTGLYNRRAFFDRLETALGDRRGREAALMYVDMDNFKPVNDIRGHKLGDLVLEKVGRLLQARPRRSRDFAARLGGDEFALWLDGVDRDTAERFAAELVQAGHDLVAHSGSADAPLSLSVGVALHDARSGEGLESLVERGDQAMYRAKEAGRQEPGYGSYALDDQAAVSGRNLGSRASG